MSEERLRSVAIDEASLPPLSREQEHERRVAVSDLLRENSFRPTDAVAGPYDLRLSLVDGRLALDIAGADYERRHILSLTGFRTVIKDYFLVCDSYNSAVRTSSPTQIEALDMGRRGLHNEGSDRLRERLADKVAIDHSTARRLFTLICALYRRL